jgi:hypothetical protein
MSSPDTVPWNNRTISGKSRRNSEDDDCAPRHREPFEKPGWSWYEIFMQISTIAFVVVDARERSRKADELRKNGVEDFKAYLSERPADLAALTSAVLLDLNDAAVEMFGGTDKSEFIGSPTHRFFDPLCPVLKNVSAAYFDGKHESRAGSLHSSRWVGLRHDLCRGDAGSEWTMGSGLPRSST